MTDGASPRWALPLVQPGQAQKEMTHNEALAAIDLLAQAAVVAAGTTTPPGSPVEGECWLIGATPTGAWTGHAGHLVGWTAGGWRFVVPRDGMTVWVATDGTFAHYTGGSWRFGDWPVATIKVAGAKVIGARRGAIASPSGGTVVDAESRTALTAILVALRAHGLIET